MYSGCSRGSRQPLIQTTPDPDVHFNRDIDATWRANRIESILLLMATMMNPTASRQHSWCFVAALATLFLRSARGVRDLQIVTPLQCLTIPDKGFDSEELLSRRQAFLERFKAGIDAEIQEGGQLDNVLGKATSAFETASQQVLAHQESRRKLQQNSSDAQKYQFVGVIQPQEGSSDAASISWYARPKPKNARWSMRLVHVNREAILKHLFDQGKIDVFGKYETSKDETTGERIVRAKYAAKPRSWR